MDPSQSQSQNQNPTQTQTPGSQDAIDSAAPPMTPEQLRDHAISVAEGADTPPVTPPASEPGTSTPGEGLDAKKLGLTVARLEKQLREQKASSDKTREDYEAILNRLKDPKQRYALIEEHGGNYQDWTQQLISGDAPQRDPKDIAIDELRQTVTELTGRLDKRDEGDQQRKQSQAVNEALQYAGNFLETNKDKYPFLSTMKQAGLLTNEAIKRHNDGNTVVGAEAEAAMAAEVEAKFAADIKNDVIQLSNNDAFVKMMAELGYQKIARKDVPETELTRRDSERVQTQTLTNDLSGEPSAGFDYHGASEQELRDRAIRFAEHAAAEERRSGQH